MAPHNANQKLFGYQDIIIIPVFKGKIININLLTDKQIMSPDMKFLFQNQFSIEDLMM